MRRRGFLTALICMLVLIACTRLPILTHEMRNHPDEHVFVQGATSLRDALLYGSEFTETKPYPEGSYFFYLPFQLLAELVERLSGIEQQARIWNRAAAVAYFALGGAVGLKILQRFFGGGKSLGIYVLLLSFSLLHMEQSRFGTGDAISFALLMLLIYCTAAWTAGGKNRFVYAAALLVGALGAVKYPQLFFALIPLGAVLTGRKDARQRWGLTAAGVGLAILGFLALSPGVVKDLGYIIDVTRRELKAYMLMGNRTEVGGPLNHAFAAAMYWLAYSDLLLAPLFAALGLRGLIKSGERTPEKTFFGIVVPVTAGLFMLYNLFVTALFMRTLYPFFGIALLYTAAGAARLLESRRALAGALIGLTVVRGCLLFGAYLPQTQAEKLDGYIAQAEQISGGGRMIGLVTNRYMTGHWTDFMEKYPQIELVELDELRRGEYPAMQSGDIVVTGPLEMARAKPYLFPISDEGSIACIEGWAQFKRENAAYYIGQSYPQWYAPLFGFWINGVVAEFDFPMNFVYAAPGNDEQR